MNDNMRGELLSLKAENKLKERLEKLEQYTRKEQVKVYGLPAVEGEDTDNIIVNLTAQMWVEISPSDISVSYMAANCHP